MVQYKLPFQVIKMSQTPTTKLDAYQTTKDNGTDQSLRYQVARQLQLDGPQTTHELTQAFDDRSKNAIRPRVNELLRMGCVKREGTRKNPSGHNAAIHHLTKRGRQYLAGQFEPEPGPTLSELKTQVIEVARKTVSGEADLDILQLSIEKYDREKERREA